MEGIANQRDSLLTWCSRLINKQIQDVKQLSDGSIFKDIIDMSLQFSTISANELEGWKGNYFLLQQQFRQLQRFYKQKTNSLPKNVDPFNLVDMAKGQDQQGLLGMLKFLFLACVKTQDPTYIQGIINLQQNHQQIFHKLIQQSATQNNDSSIDIQLNKDKQKMNQLMFHLQSITFQHQSLKVQFQEQAQNNLKLKQINRRLQQQNKKLQKDLNQIIFVRSKQQQIDERINKINNDQSSQIIQQLKMQMYQQEQKYQNQIRKIKQKMEILQDQLAQSRKFNSEYKTKQIQCIQLDHTKCVSLKKYNQQIAKYSAQIKQIAQNQHKANMQIIQYKNKILQLNTIKLKLQVTQNQQKNYIDKGQADQFKIQMCKMLRDKFKKVLQETNNQNIVATKSKNNNNNSKIQKQKYQKQNKTSQDQINLLLQSQIKPKNQNKQNMYQNMFQNSLI